MGRRAEQVPENYTLDNFRAWTDRSRRNLGVDTLDLVQLHCPPTAGDRATTRRTTRWTPWSPTARSRRTASASRPSTRRSSAIARPHVATVQIILNAFRLKPLDEVLPAAGQAGVGIIARVPLASGLLSGKYDRSPPSPRTTTAATTATAAPSTWARRSRASTSRPGWTRPREFTELVAGVEGTDAGAGGDRLGVAAARRDAPSSPAPATPARRVSNAGAGGGPAARGRPRRRPPDLRRAPARGGPSALVIPRAVRGASGARGRRGCRPRTGTSSARRRSARPGSAWRSSSSARHMPVVEAGVVDDDVGGQHRQAGGDLARVQVVDVVHVRQRRAGARGRPRGRGRAASTPAARRRSRAAAAGARHDQHADEQRGHGVGAQPAGGGDHDGGDQDGDRAQGVVDHLEERRTQVEVGAARAAAGCAMPTRLPTRPTTPKTSIAPDATSGGASSRRTPSTMTKTPDGEQHGGLRGGGEHLGAPEAPGALVGRRAARPARRRRPPG